MSINRRQKKGRLGQVQEQEPRYQDFGISKEQYLKYTRGHNPYYTILHTIAFIIALIIGIVIGSSSEDFKTGFIVGFVTWIGLSILAQLLCESMKKQNPVYQRIKLYENAVLEFKQHQLDYWKSLKAEVLEYAIADLYKHRGYTVKHTPRTDDKGIDLILTKNKATTIVQCKGYKNPVGPAVVRELMGTLVSSDAKEAILVCPVGFSRGAKEAAGVDIELISAPELVKMANDNDISKKEESERNNTSNELVSDEVVATTLGKEGLIHKEEESDKIDTSPDLIFHEEVAISLRKEDITKIHTKPDLIPHQRVVVTLSNCGLIKRVPSNLYTLQRRGGRGITAHPARENDPARLLVIADIHDNLLIFTNRGKVYRLKCYEIPSANSRTAKGHAIINLIPIPEGERVTDIVVVTNLVPDTYLMMVTLKGKSKKTSSDQFAIIHNSGHIAMHMDKDDELIRVCLVTDRNEIMIVTQQGQSIRFPVNSLRATLITSRGVKGIRLGANDQVIGMDIADPEGFILVVSENGFGKLTPVNEYPLQKRAGIGVKTYKTTEKTGFVATAMLATLTQQVMLISANGIVLRTPVKEKDPRKGIITQGRSTQGVRLMKLEPGDKVSAVTCFDAN